MLAQVLNSVFRVRQVAAHYLIIFYLSTRNISSKWQVTVIFNERPKIIKTADL